jgi:predicted amidophosphoribosyltransferase
MLDAWLDLVLGSRCSACARPGRALCRVCAGQLPGRAVPAWPTPVPAGLVPPWSAGEYAEPLRSLVVDHKDHGRLALARPLGRLLAVAVTAAWAGDHRTGTPGGHDTGTPGGLVLVPVPSHPAVVRRRGQDPLLRISLQAAAELRRRGMSVAVRPVLCVDGRPGDQAGLGAGQRARNVAGRFRVRTGSAPLRSGTGTCPPLLLVDDVITTGATLREAQRALEIAGLGPFAAATIAATRRRLPPGAPGSDPGYPTNHRGASV